MDRLAWWRPALAGVAGVLGAIALIREAGHQFVVVITAILGLVIAAGVVWHSTFGAQLLARAIWWSNLALGALLCTSGGRSESNAGIVVAFGTGIALLVIGRKGLAVASERAEYLPAAFRSSLLLLMILALADAQTFALIAVVEFQKASPSWNVFFEVAMAIGFVVGFVGLYRIRVWGALLNVGLAVICLGVVGTIFSAWKDVIAGLFIAISTLQILAALPLILSLTTKRTLPSLPLRVRFAGTTIGIVSIMAFSAVQFFRNR